MQISQLTSLASRREALAFLQNAPFWADNWPRHHTVYDNLLASQKDWWLAEHEGQWQWLAALTPLAFDSRLFGQSMAWLHPLVHKAAWPQAGVLAGGRAFIEHLQQAAHNQGFNFLMARLNSRDLLGANCLEAAGFKLMDVSVEWMLTQAQRPSPPARPGLSIAPWQEEERAALLVLAGRAFSNLEAYGDRFTLDPKLRPFSGKLYETWLVNSLNGEQADQVLVLRQEGRVVGFISLRLPTGGNGPDGDCGWVVLNAVDEAKRGQGLYSYMLGHALNWLFAKGARAARIRTKVNQAAVINAWSALGARQVWADMSFHWWSAV